MQGKFYKLIGITVIALFSGFSLFAQQGSGSAIPLGKVSDLLNAIKSTGTTTSTPKTSSSNLRVSSSEEFTHQLNAMRKDGKSNILIGRIANKPSSEFFLKTDGINISGNILLKKEKRAYKYFARNGESFLEEVEINSVVCQEYVRQNNNLSTAAVTDYPTNLESHPGAQAVVLLDFDGHYLSGSRWNSGLPIDAQPSGLTAEEVQTAFKIVSEDYSPFNINITTNESVYLAAAADKRMRVIVTPTTTAEPYSGGVAYIGSFTWGDDTPCWVFNLGGKVSGETASHEIGHTLGLYHDGVMATSTTPYEEYYYGHDNWSPIMGFTNIKEQVQWSKGEYPNASNFQDDISIITTQNGFSLKPDESLSVLSISSSGYVSGHGNIQTSSDKDGFIFRSNGDSVSINANTFAPYTNLDVQLTVRNLNDQLIASAEGSKMGATLNAYLAPGAYKLEVDGTKGAMGANSDYGSLGFFALGGKFTPSYKTNLALNKPVEVSSYEYSDYAGSKAVDGNQGTRWSSHRVDPQWIKVDLQNNYKIERVKIKWETAYAKDFKLQISNDGSTWQDVKTIVNNTVLLNEFTGLNSNGRYLRVYGTKRGTIYGYSIFELEVYGTPANTAPIVSLSSPEKNSKFNVPATINLSAVAFDPDGTISKVEFYNGTTLLGTDTQAPYAYSWNVSQVGAYSVSAKAFDNLGASFGCPPITINLEYENIALNKQAIATSFANDDYPSHSTDGLLATVWTSESTDPQSITLDLNEAYNVFRIGINWGNSFASDYQILASFDNRNWRVIKSVVNNAAVYNNFGSLNEAFRYLRINCIKKGTAFTNYSLQEITLNGTRIANTPPVVTITAPAVSPLYLTTSPTNVSLSASASDADGSVAAVEFYSSGMFIGRDSIAPYTAVMESFNGMHTIYAVAYDNYGALTTSASREVFVESDNIALNKATQTSSVKDNASAGSFALDANFATQWTSATTSPSSQWFTVNLNSIYNIYMVRIFWGENQYAEDFEIQLSNDNTNWRTLRSVTGNTSPESYFMYFAEDTRYIRIFCTSPGGNAGYAIRELVVYGAEQSNTPPSIAITSPTPNSVFNSISPINISANASDPNGSISKVEFLVNNTVIVTDNASPFSASWTPSASGTYTITAIAYDNLNTSATSSAVNITINVSAVSIPGRVQAESYTTMSGVQLENTKDVGGGQNVGWIDNNDWMEYTISAPQDGTYKADFRIASIVSTAQLKLMSGSNVLTTLTLPITGGWQNWQTVSANVNLKAGINVLRLQVVSGKFNINWIDFSLATGTATLVALSEGTENKTRVYPNPADKNIQLDYYSAEIEEGEVLIKDPFNNLILSQKHTFEKGNNKITLKIEGVKDGVYLLQVLTSRGKIIKRIQIQH